MPSSFELGQDVFAPGKEESASSKEITPDKEYYDIISDPKKSNDMKMADLLFIKTKKDRYLQDKKTQAIDKAMKDFESSVGVYRVDATKMPQFQPPKYSPQPIIGREELGVLGAAMAGLSLLGSALTRTGTIGAMNAFAAGLTGYHAGKAEAVRKNFQEFETQFKSALAEHNANVEKYKQLLLNDREDVEVRLAELRAAIKADDGYTPSMDSFDAAWDYITKLDLAGKKAEGELDKVNAKIAGDVERERMRLSKERPEKKTVSKPSQKREAIMGKTSAVDIAKAYHSRKITKEEAFKMQKEHGISDSDMMAALKSASSIGD